MSSKEVARPEQQSLMRSDNPTVLEVIRELAVDPRVDVEKLGALMQLQERAEAKNAEREFNAAFARLQPQLPRIKKNGAIDLGRGKPIQFARYEDIDFAIRPLLTAEGFSLSFSSIPTPAGVIMTGTLAHILGHARSSQMQLPADAGPGRNALQAIGSARSYGKRYLVFDLLNIITEGADDNAQAVGWVTDQQADSIMSMLEECGMKTDPSVQANFLKYMNAKTVSEIRQADYKKAITALENKRRAVK